MADTHNSSARRDGSRLKRNVSKMAFRSKEKVLRTMGIVEETKDEILDHYVVLINRQQAHMHKLQRELKQYILAIKAMGHAHNSFYQALYDVYDDDWSGKDAIATLSQRSKELHEELCTQLTNEISGDLLSHIAQYKDAKVSVDKRGRKLVDYDVARRNLISLKAAKKPDAYRIDKAQEHENLSKEMYDLLNNQLHDQLPTLYDSRLPVTCNTYRSVCEHEQKFYTEIVDLRLKLQSILENTNTAFDQGEYHIQRMKPAASNNRSASTLPASRNNQIEGHSPTSATVTRESSRVNGYDDKQKDSSTHDYINLQVNTNPDTKTEDEEKPQNYVMAEDYAPSKPTPVSRTKSHQKQDSSQPKVMPKPLPRTAVSPQPEENADENGQTNHALEEDEDIKTSNETEQPIYEVPPDDLQKSNNENTVATEESKDSSTSPGSQKYLDLPPNYLHSVQAIFKYESTDDDELMFNKGEIIHVVEFPIPEEQDEGWEMGIKQSDWEETADLEQHMGVFPENFTKRIQL